MHSIKQRFPIFDFHPDLIFADNASTTHKPAEVINAVSEYYKASNANIHRSVYDLGIASDELLLTTREKLCDMYQKETCVFTNGTTDGINQLARSFGEILVEGENVVVSEMEHHSNYLPWQELCNRTGATLRVSRITDEGELDFEHLSILIDENTRIIALVHISNTLGTINNLEKVETLIRDDKTKFVVDAAQSCSLHIEQIRRLNADAVVFGAHKMFGPTGVGVILAKESLLKLLQPSKFGGGMVNEVGLSNSIYKTNISGFEAGTPPIAQIAGFNAALEFIESLDLGQFCQHVSTLGKSLRQGLEKVGIECLGPDHGTTGIVSTNFGSIHPHDVASYLNAQDIAVRAGHHCTQLIMERYNLQSTVRFSFTIYNQEEEIQTIIDAILTMQKFFS